MFFLNFDIIGTSIGNKEEPQMFVIVNTQTGQEHKLKHWHISAATYDTERGAKSACTKLNRAFTGCELRVANGKDVVQWEVMSLRDWHVYKALKFPVKMVTRINLMSGKEYQEAEDTPLCCSPASETYWSM